MKKNQKCDFLIPICGICCILLVIASGIRTRIDIKSPTTPPSLLGMARKIAYANKKYHSGWIWAGVTNGFAGVKFSGSIRENG